MRRTLRATSSRRKPSRKRDVKKPANIRLNFVLMAILLGFCGMSARLLWVGTVPYNEPPTRLADLPEEQPRRGNIYDVKGKLLATSLKVHSLYADPKMVMDPNEAVEKLQAVLPALNQNKLTKRLSSKKRFVWIKRHLTPAQAHEINALGVPGLGFREELVRLYPQGRLASHVLGAVDVDSQGIAGLEGGYNDELSRGEDVYTTLDVMVQQQLRKTLLETLETSEAKSASAVVMNPKTGAIQAMVSLPDFDPNHYGKTAVNARLNRTTQALYEMGSTFKLFTIAKAFEENEFDLDSELDCRKPLKIGKYRIRDFHAKNKVLTAREVVMYSSNIGVAQMADAIGGDRLRGFFNELNLTSKLREASAKTAQPLLPKRWGRTQTMTVSFGHGIAVTPLHVAASVSTLVSDGIYKAPYLVANNNAEVLQPIVSKNTIKKVRDVMHSVVLGGSGRSAKVAGYTIGGKTGTAEKSSASGGYDKGSNVASFVGAVPLENPEMVALIMVEDGKKGYATGGQVAAPAFGKFVKRTLPLLGIWPKSEETENNAKKQLAYAAF